MNKMFIHASVLLGLLPVSVMAQDKPPRAGDAELLPLPENQPILSELAQPAEGLLTKAVKDMPPDGWIPITEVRK